MTSLRFYKNIRVMKKSFIIIIVLVSIVVAAKFTVPSNEKHYEVATKQLTAYFEEKIVDGDDYDEIIEDYGIDKEKALQFLVENGLYKAVVQQLVDDNLFIKDYFVCNVGKFTYEGETYPLTLGLFGHVFVLTDYMDEIQEMNEKMQEIQNDR